MQEYNIIIYIQPKHSISKAELSRAKQQPPKSLQFNRTQEVVMEKTNIMKQNNNHQIDLSPSAQTNLENNMKKAESVAAQTVHNHLELQQNNDIQGHSKHRRQKSGNPMTTTEENDLSECVQHQSSQVPSVSPQMTLQISNNTGSAKEMSMQYFGSGATSDDSLAFSKQGTSPGILSKQPTVEQVDSFKANLSPIIHVSDHQQMVGNQPDTIFFPNAQGTKQQDSEEIEDETDQLGLGMVDQGSVEKEKTTPNFTAQQLRFNTEEYAKSNKNPFKQNKSIPQAIDGQSEEAEFSKLVQQSNADGIVHRRSTMMVVQAAQPETQTQANGGHGFSHVAKYATDMLPPLPEVATSRKTVDTKSELERRQLSPGLRMPTTSSPKSNADSELRTKNKPKTKTMANLLSVNTGELRMTFENNNQLISKDGLKSRGAYNYSPTSTQSLLKKIGGSSARSLPKDVKRWPSEDDDPLINKNMIGYVKGALMGDSGLNGVSIGTPREFHFDTLPDESSESRPTEQARSLQLNRGDQQLSRKNTHNVNVSNRNTTRGRKYNNKQNNMEQFLKLEKCSDDDESHSLGSISDREEDKDHIGDMDITDETNVIRKQFTIQAKIVRGKSHPQSSHQLVNRRHTEFSGQKSPYFRGDRSCYSNDLSYNFDQPPLRRSNSHEKRAIVDVGRSPQVAFVQNLRTSLKRNSSQRLYQRRNFSPNDAREKDRDWCEQSEQLRRQSFGKSQNDSARKRKLREPASSAEKVSHSPRSSSNTTPLHPEEVFKKYEDFPDRSLKVSVYKDISIQIIQAINIIQQIKQFPAIQPEEQIEFKFKKSGFNKLLIFDLDETLIHSKRDDNELEFDELEEHYNVEPDLFVQMESPGSEYGMFEQGVYSRPYLHECLRAANLDYEVAVFTAGYDWYANPIIDKIDPSGTLIQHRFFRQHAQTITYKGQESLYKDLSVLRGLDLSQTLFVDNQVFSFATHLSNGIPIAGFYGSKKDCELIKIMKYVHQIAQEEDLAVANERQFQLRAMLDTPIQKFVSYYQIDEMSESDENDFEEDGQTMRSSPRVGYPMQLFGAQGGMEETDSLVIPSDDYGEEMHLNSSLEGEERASRNRSSIPDPEEPPRMIQTLQSTQLLRLVSLSPELARPSPQLTRHSSAQHQQEATSGLVGATAGTGLARVENQYARISKNDEGNIGGTLSNNNLEINALENIAAADESSAVMAFGDVLQQVEQTTALRVPQVRIDEIASRGETSPTAGRPSSPSGKKSAVRLQRPVDVAPSSYYKVCLSTEKAKRRQSSLGQRSQATRNNETDSNAQQSYRGGQLAHFAHNRIPNYKPTAKVGKSKFGDQRSYATGPRGSEPAAGSESYRGLKATAPAVARESDQNSAQASEPFSFADIVEMEQKTLTSVKKTAKIGMAADLASSPIGAQSKSKKAPAPSRAFIDKVITNTNNTLKPPNWTVRKQSLMHRMNSMASPCCASNIDYHLDQLSSMYKESGRKVREGVEPSLMEQLLEANPSNASFLTPGSSARLTQSFHSEQKKMVGSQSLDKYDQLKNDINRSSNTKAAQQRRLIQQHSAHLTTYVAPVNANGSENQSSCEKSSQNQARFQIKTHKVAAGAINTGTLPPRPANKTKKRGNVQVTPHTLAMVPKFVHQHSETSPEKSRQGTRLLEEESGTESARGLVKVEAKAPVPDTAGQSKAGDSPTDVNMLESSFRKYKEQKQ